MEEIKICEAIRIRRQRKGISQDAMAFYLNISQAAYSKMENGETEIKIPRLYDIADILEISVFELLPKSKYGTGINIFGLKGALRKLRNFFTFKSRKRNTEPGE
ncbi:MAG: helix-turn-helix domain-containing protein [Daejeonella sp.]|uniref:helix-turn-helix domain-containing protein n=1 Tax=Daejeonella sp. JGW-45 TaxID=3034148 RepID=UPI0023EDC09D|nr:helix-turn-helix transcriptional regulator [Daejeonella sp. JGW-45]